MTTATPTISIVDRGAPLAPFEREIGRVDSGLDGPSLVVIGGVHGNERAGIFAARRVLEVLRSDRPCSMRGSFVALCGNLAALNDPDPDTRYIDHDLNRLCTPERFDEPVATSAEHGQMHGLFDALAREHGARRGPMVVLDLHTTSAPASPILAMEDTLANRWLADSIPLPRYLGLEEDLPGLVFDEASRRFRCATLLIEGGQHNDPSSVDVHEASVWALLVKTGIIDKGCVPKDRFNGRPSAWLSKRSGELAHAVYDLRHQESITDPDFIAHEGIVSGAPARAGHTVVARQGGRDLVAPVDGEVFLPNLQPHKRIGDDAYFIVRRVGHGWVDLSARLRTQGWIHTLIEHCPGVHAHDSGVLLVEADLAAVLKRQVFHLLGYRLVRHDDRIGGHGVTRFVRGVRAFVHALFHRPTHSEIDPDDPRFWVVRRRTLDVFGAGSDTLGL